MRAPTLSVIVPTVYRPTLARALGTLAGGLGPGDEVLVCPDGPRLVPVVRELVDQLPLPARILELGGPHNDWGHTLRNRAQAQARGEWLVYLDDDDGYKPGALPLLRAVLAAAERVPHVFRMAYPDGRLLWREPVIEVGNVSTVMLCVPNDPARLGRWGDRYEGDHDFLASAVALCGGRCAWRDELIADVRPWGGDE